MPKTVGFLYYVSESLQTKPAQGSLASASMSVSCSVETHACSVRGALTCVGYTCFPFFWGSFLTIWHARFVGMTNLLHGSCYKERSNNHECLCVWGCNLGSVFAIWHARFVGRSGCHTPATSPTEALQLLAKTKGVMILNGCYLVTFWENFPDLVTVMLAQIGHLSVVVSIDVCL